MPLKRAYNEDGYDPPAPVIEVVFSPPVEGAQRREVPAQALIDSGADGTCIPQRIADELGLQHVDETDVQGITGPRERAPVYAASVRIEGIGKFIVRASAVGGEVLLGRDIINRWRLLLDGPNKVFDIKSAGT